MTQNLILDGWLTSRLAADHLRVSLQGLTEMRKQGIISGRLIGRRWYYNPHVIAGLRRRGLQGGKFRVTAREARTRLANLERRAFALFDDGVRDLRALTNELEIPSSEIVQIYKKWKLSNVDALEVHYEKDLRRKKTRPRPSLPSPDPNPDVTGYFKTSRRLGVHNVRRRDPGMSEPQDP